ncbi:Glutamate synthase [NADPH] small chain [hydrothermal vent metagenome]|uniref:Glutamate synthase [NADPH] small chain n=1 Tax=hydrothermal vent metagenome TaxID=652676 RepID=A0A3B0TYI2_9ZZZZ
MGKVTGFLEIDRRDRKYLPAADRIRNFKEFVIPLGGEATKDQAARCMDCGIPYCHTGCPVNNQIPDWNDLVYRGDWRRALLNLHSTNNFPEFTGRVCPAPCEASCTLNLTEAPVTIKTIECAIVDRGWKEGWIAPEPPADKSGKKVAIVGAGPAGMACAQQLARVGHEVQLFDRQARPGGLMRYGIPDFKMEKRLIDRRMGQMEAEGVVFHGNCHIGVDTPAAELVGAHDAVVLTGGSETPRDLPVKGRDLAGIHFAMEFLAQQNRRVGGEDFDEEPILATGKHVVVIGGGDTGSDCIGTSFRQGALSVTQIEIMPRPPENEDKLMVWPEWPTKMRTSSSQAEGAVRDWSVSTTRFVGKNGYVTGLDCVRVDDKFQPIAGSEFKLKADLVLLAMGFVHPVHEGLLEELAVKRDGRGNVEADMVSYRTSLAGVFSAGDMRRGQSLIVWAIREGRQAAHAVDKFLMGSTTLPR